jgi:hypothetical protein
MVIRHTTENGTNGGKDVGKDGFISSRNESHAAKDRRKLS